MFSLLVRAGNRHPKLKMAETVWTMANWHETSDYALGFHCGTSKFLIFAKIFVQHSSNVDFSLVLLAHSNPSSYIAVVENQEMKWFNHHYLFIVNCNLMNKLK